VQNIKIYCTFFIDKMLPGLIKVSYLITTARAY